MPSKRLVNAPGNVNGSRLLEELLATGLPVLAIGLQGFDQSNRRLAVPLSGPRVYMRKKDSTGEVVKTAQPGDVEVVSPQDLTPAQLSILSGVLDDHDPAVPSAEQAAEDKDADDEENLLAAFQSNSIGPQHVKKLLRAWLRSRRRL